MQRVSRKGRLIATLSYSNRESVLLVEGLTEWMWLQVKVIGPCLDDREVMPCIRVRGNGVEAWLDTPILAELLFGDEFGSNDGVHAEMTPFMV